MELKNTLVEALDGDERATSRLCDHCRRVAVAYLRTKIRYDDFLLQHLYSSIDDLALDCIADLFGRKGDCLFQIEEYMDRTECEIMSEPEVQSKIRRLIFSKVNEGLYKNYRSFDPSLSKIIRNLKRTLEEEKVEGAAYNAESGEILFGEEHSNKPAMPEELLAIKLGKGLTNISNSVEAIERLQNILNKEKAYRSTYNLVSFAITFRKQFAQLLKMEEEKEDIKPRSTFKKEEIRYYIQRNISKIRDTLEHTYVNAGKLSEDEFDRYLEVAGAFLEAEYIEASELEGHYEHFRAYFPEVEYEEYRAHQRKTLEYIIKKIRKQLILDLKNEEKFSKRYGR